MTYDYSDGAAIGFLIFMFFFWFIVLIAGYVLGSIFLMKIFDKAGVEGRWRAWVPVYNAMIFFKLGDLSPWLVLYALGASILLSWIPVIGQLIGLAAFVLSLLAAWRVGLKLQKEAVWLILYFFLAIVWLGIAAFDKSKWNLSIPAAPWASNGFLGDRTTWASIPSQVPAGGYPPNPATAPSAGYSAPPAPPTGYAPPAPPAAAPETPEAPESGEEPKA